MARQRGVPDTKERLIDAAWELFCRVGYEATTIEAIIAHVGLSKGAFYHYFSAKEAVLEAVTERMTRRAVASITPIARAPGIPALERWQLFVAASQTWSREHIDIVREMFRVLYREENLIIRHKLTASANAAVLPLFADIVRQGVAEGVFQVTEIEDTARLILHVSAIAKETIYRLLCVEEATPDTLATVRRQFGFYMAAIERLLGVAPGALAPPDPNLFDMIYRQFTKES